MAGWVTEWQLATVVEDQEEEEPCPSLGDASEVVRWATGWLIATVTVVENHEEGESLVCWKRRRTSCRGGREGN